MGCILSGILVCYVTYFIFSQNYNLDFHNNHVSYCYEKTEYGLTINKSYSNNYNEPTNTGKCRAIVTACHQRQNSVNERDMHDNAHIQTIETVFSRSRERGPSN